jgi:hypothetical protein
LAARILLTDRFGFAGPAMQDTLLYLRQFSKLKALNLAGNGLCATPHYEQRVVAMLPGLRYLDWNRINDELVRGASLPAEEVFAKSKRLIPHSITAGGCGDSVSGPAGNPPHQGVGFGAQPNLAGAFIF